MILEIESVNISFFTFYFAGKAYNKQVIHMLYECLYGNLCVANLIIFSLKFPYETVHLCLYMIPKHYR